MLDVIFKKRNIIKMLSPILGMLITLLSLLNYSGGVMDLPKIPDKFIPVMRFTIASDVHINDASDTRQIERLGNMIKKSYELAEDGEYYQGLDAICFAGDLSNQGLREGWEAFSDVCKQNIKGDTLMLPVMGNHDFFEYGEDSRKVFSEVFEHGTEFDFNVKGFHIIGISETGSGKGYGSPAQGFLSSHIQQAKKENKEYPIFVVQHEHPFNTVYGGINWSAPELTPTLMSSSRIVDFSGHSHYPVNDPRSFWQGGFTSVGTGSLFNFELEVDGITGIYPANCENAAQFRIVEVNAQGSVLIKSYDMISDSYFEETYFIEKPSDSSTFAYNTKNMMKKNQAPAFAPDTQLMAVKKENGQTALEFPAASDDQIVHNYRIVVKDDKGNYVFEDFRLSDYYFIPSPTQYSFEIGELQSGKQYTATVAAQDAYSVNSVPIKLTFTAE